MSAFYSSYHEYSQVLNCFIFGGYFYGQGTLLLIYCNCNPSMDKYSHPLKMWGETMYSLPNFNCCTVGVWEWISNFIPQFTGHVFDLNKLHKLRFGSRLIKWSWLMNKICSAPKLNKTPKREARIYFLAFTLPVAWFQEPLFLIQIKQDWPWKNNYMYIFLDSGVMIETWHMWYHIPLNWSCWQLYI